MFNLPSLVRMPSTTHVGSNLSVAWRRATDETVEIVHDPRRQRFDDIKQSVSRYLATKSNLANYQLPPQFFTAIVAGGFMDRMALPQLAQPAVHGFIAAIGFTMAGKVAELALGKITHEQFMGGVRAAEQGVQQQARLAIRDYALEAGTPLSNEEIEQLYKELVPRLTLAQLAKLAVATGTVFVALGYTAMIVGSGLAAAGVMGTEAVALESLLMMGPNIGGGMVLAGLHEQLRGAAGTRGQTLVTSGSLLASSLAEIANAALPAGISPQAKTLLNATITSSVGWLLVAVQNLFWERKKSSSPAIAAADLGPSVAITPSSLDALSRRGPVETACDSSVAYPQRYVQPLF